MDNTNVNEARRLINLIDKSKIKKKEDFIFVLSIENRIQFSAEITRKQIFWLRDIKDSQLEKEN